MGLITVVVVEDLASVKRRNRLQTYASNERQISDLSIPNLASLLSIVRKVKYSDSLEEEIPVLYESRSKGSWIFKIPDEIVDVLAEMTSKDLSKLARSWRERDQEFSLRNSCWKLKDIQQMLADLRRSSIEAKESGKPVLIRTCL